MASGQTVTESRAGGHEEEQVSDATAEKHDQELATVQRLLNVRGVRSCLIHTIALRMFGDGRLLPRGNLGLYAPELVVRSGAGWGITTVSVGSRSGCFLVSMRNGRGIETAPSVDPEKVADLILSAQFGGRV